MDSFSSFKSDDSTSLNSMKLMSPIEPCYRSPLRDTTNCILPVEVGGSKKSDPVGPQQLPGEKREFREENDFPQHQQQSTPVKHLDCDTESDTTAEYESAGEASPWEKPSNVSALADYLAGVHLSTPDKIHTELTYFPFSPISAEDECDDEVTAIISNASQSSSQTLSFHEREEISVSKHDTTVLHVADTSFSDVDPEEFKNSVPCKRHSETNISSCFHPETLQFSNEAIVKSEADIETEMSCSIETYKLKTPSPSLNESEEITSSVVAMVDQLCDSVSNKITSEAISPKKYSSLNLSSSGNITESILTDSITSVANAERKLVEQSPLATRSVISFPSNNKSPLPMVIEKDITSLDSLENNDVAVSTEMDSSSNVLRISHINDYVTTTKHKIDTIFNSNKEIVSNVISETKQQIDNMFKRKSPIKELPSNTVITHAISSIKNLNSPKLDSSPQKNSLLEKVSSPISSAKQKIDSLFLPKKTVHDEDISDVAVVKELGENELFKKENYEANQNNSSFNTVTIEHLDVEPPVSGLSVIPLTSSDNDEAIEATKQQIDKIFKSLSPLKVECPNEVLGLSNAAISSHLEQEYKVSPTPEPVFEQHNSKTFLETKSSVGEASSCSIGAIVSALEETAIDQSLVSSKGKPESSLVLIKDQSTELENPSETCTISEVILPVDLNPDAMSNISSDLSASGKHLTESISDELLNNTTAGETCQKTHPEETVVVQSDKETVLGVDDFQVINNSISQKNIKSVEENLSDYQSTFQVLNKDDEKGRTFHVISPKKESLNISLSAILDHKDSFSENITDPLSKLPASDLIIINMSENHCQKTDAFAFLGTTNSGPRMPPTASNLDQSVVMMEHENLGVTDDSLNVTHLESSEIINDNVAELNRTADEKVIGNQMVCKEPDDFDSQLIAQQEGLDASAVADQMSMKKEEIEDFVVVDVAELDNNVSVPGSLQSSSSYSQDREVLATSYVSGQFGVEKKLNDTTENMKQTASELDVSQMEVDENQVQIEPSPLVKGSTKDNAEATIRDVKKQIDDKNIKENDRSNINISELDLVASTVNIQEDVKCSSLVVSSVTENDVSLTVCDGHQLNFQSQEVTTPDVEIVESKISITESNLFSDDVKKTATDVSALAEKRSSDVKETNIQSQEVIATNVELVEKGESKININENNLSTDVEAKKEATDVSVLAEERETDVVGANIMSQEVMAPNIELVKKVEPKISVTENNLSTDVVVEKEATNVNVLAEEREADVKRSNLQLQEAMTPNADLVEKVEPKINVNENNLSTDVVVKNETADISAPAGERETDVVGANIMSQEVMAPNVELVEKVEPKINITENNLSTDVVVEKEATNVSVPDEERNTDVKEDLQSQGVMTLNVDLVEKVEPKIIIVENNLSTDVIVEKETTNVSVPVEERETGVGANILSQEVMAPNIELVEKVEPKISADENNLSIDVVEKVESKIIINENNVSSDVVVENKTTDLNIIEKTDADVKGKKFQSLDVIATNVQLVEKVESKSSNTEDNSTSDLVVKLEEMHISIPKYEKLTGAKVTGVDANISVPDAKNDFNKKTDDSSLELLRNDIEKEQTIDSHSQNIERTHDFEVNQIQSVSKQGQTYREENMCHLAAKIQEEKYAISEINSEKKIEHHSPKVSTKNEQVMVKQANLDGNDRSAKNSADNAVINESGVSFNNVTYKPSSNERKISPGPAANDLFGEIFQHGKDQMCKIATIYAESKQSKSEVSIIKEQIHETIELNCNKTTSFSKSTDDLFKNAGFSSEHVLSEKVKSPPFACPVSSDTISFGSPPELSLSPINTFTPGTVNESPKGSPSANSANDNTSTVSYNKTYSSSAEIGMGSKNSSESLETIKSDVSKQNNELSSSLQATLQTQGEMSTRNENYTCNVSKNSKDFRSSPLSKNSEELKFSSLSDNFKTFKLDDLSKSTVERKSYEDLLDRCFEQERLLGFDETIKEEADKLIQEIANASSDDICMQPDDFPPANTNSSEAGPVTADEDLNKADFFQDASLFDFDYLSKIGKGKPSRRLVRESLFLKFDPLAAAAAAGATPEPAQEMAQADSSSDVVSTPTRAPPVHNGDDKLVSITPNDEAACSPASSTVATPPRSKPRTSSCSATPTLRHEILSKEISKLQDLMMRQESSYQEQIAARTEEVELLREQLAELEARDNQSDLQGKLAATEAEAAKLRKELSEAADSKKQLMMIMEEYEKTISQVVTMREDDKKKFEIEKEQISMEREGAMQHLRNMEIAFNDVHQKYEKCKEVIEAFKHNEVQYKISLNENRKTIIQQEENYQKLKEHATQKLEEASIEITEMKKAHQAEIAKMVAVQRKMEIRVKSLEESLEQKKREAAELTKICDDLITKVEQ